MSDAFGNPIRFILTGGKVSDYTQAISLLSDQAAKSVLADKGYDANHIIENVYRMGAEIVIPSRKTRKIQGSYDKFFYKDRNLIERMFGKRRAIQER